MYQLKYLPDFRLVAESLSKLHFSAADLVLYLARLHQNNPQRDDMTRKACTCFTLHYSLAWYLIHAHSTGELVSQHSTAHYDSVSQKATPIDIYGSYMKFIYTHEKLPMYDKWPQVESKKYINPVLIRKQKITKKEADYLIRSTVCGNIDAISIKQIKMDISQIAQLPDGSQPKCILVEGAPGIGKSTFAWNLCRKWGKGRLLQQYQLVVLLRLRDKSVQAAKSISDLFQYDDPQFQPAAVDEIQRIRGERVFLLFEGYDELPEGLRTSSSIFLDVITGRKLPEATVLITSRPWASEFLLRKCKKHISQRIEIMGFTKDDIQSYLESITANDPSLVAGLKNLISHYPYINSLMYSPLNCAIVVDVYQQDDYFDVETMTELYFSLIRSLLLRYLFDHPVHGEKKWRLLNFSDLPSDVYKQLCEVSRMAYEGIFHKKQVVFSDLPDDFETLGLMHCVSELYSDEGVAVSHSFLHLTVQEYLAAFHLSLQPVEKQIEHFQKYGRAYKQHLHHDIGIDEKNVKKTGSVDKGIVTSNCVHNDDSIRRSSDNHAQPSNSLNDEEIENDTEGSESEDIKVVHHKRAPQIFDSSSDSEHKDSMDTLTASISSDDNMRRSSDNHAQPSNHLNDEEIETDTEGSESEDIKVVHHKRALWVFDSSSDSEHKDSMDTLTASSSSDDNMRRSSDNHAQPSNSLNDEEIETDTEDSESEDIKVVHHKRAPWIFDSSSDSEHKDSMDTLTASSSSDDNIRSSDNHAQPSNSSNGEEIETDTEDSKNEDIKVVRHKCAPQIFDSSSDSEHTEDENYSNSMEYKKGVEKSGSDSHAQPSLVPGLVRGYAQPSDSSNDEEIETNSEEHESEDESIKVIYHKPKSMRWNFDSSSDSEDCTNENHRMDYYNDSMDTLTASSPSDDGRDGNTVELYIYESEESESEKSESEESESGDNEYEYESGDTVSSVSEESDDAENDDSMNEECSNHFLAFLCGLSKFSKTSKVLELLIKVYPDNGSEDGTVTPVVTMNSLRLLFETQELTTILGSSNVQFYDPVYDITPFDCFVLGYCVSHSSCSWKVDLRSCGIGDEGVEKIVQGIRTVEDNTQLTGSISEINLSDNDITCNGMRHLLDIPRCLIGELETLNVSHNQQDPQFYEVLSKFISDTPYLKTFNLNGIGNPESMMRGDVICSEFTASLTALRSLEVLNLVWTGIGEDLKDCQALCKLLSPLVSLRKLCVSHLPCESVELIINHVDGNTTLESLYMADSYFSFKVVNSLASALRRNHTLVDLNLRRCSIDSDGACRIAGALCTNSTLQKLWLEGNSIEAVAAAEFAEMLHQNKSLKELNLQRRHNFISKEGTQKLIDSLKHNTSLEKLYISWRCKPEAVPAWCRSRVVFRSAKNYTSL